jgi:hypothetical protein
VILLGKYTEGDNHTLLQMILEVQTGSELYEDLIDVIYMFSTIFKYVNDIHVKYIVAGFIRGFKMY